MTHDLLEGITSVFVRAAQAAADAPVGGEGGRVREDSSLDPTAGMSGEGEAVGTVDAIR